MQKLLLYLTNTQLVACTWAGGAIASGRNSFPNDEEGRRAFETFLAGHTDVRTYLLADLVEEDFQQHTVPHVYGKAHRMLVERKLGQLYRDTPYRQGMVQGREKDGRKDDRLTLSALTNPGILKPWIDTFKRLDLPFGGVYSPALVSTSLVRKLGLADEYLLLVTHQSSGLRQSFFQGNALKFSRLTSLPTNDPAAVEAAVQSETLKTRQFLWNARLLPRAEPLRIAVLGNDAELAQLAGQLQEEPNLAYQLLPYREVAPRLGMKNLAGVALGDELFLSWLGKAAPSGQYAPPEDRKRYRLWTLRAGLYGATAALFALSLSWAGYNAYSTRVLEQDTAAINQDTMQTMARYRRLLTGLPADSTRPAVMRASVKLQEMLQKNGPLPAQAMLILSDAMEAIPDIRLERIDWRASEADPFADPGADPMAPPPAGGDGVQPAPTPGALGIPEAPYQVMQIEGRVEPFRENYREVIGAVQRFAGVLARAPQARVKIVQSPFDVSPRSKLSAKSGTPDDAAQAPARFVLRMAWRP